jgi:hypothetical protein
MNLVMFGCVSVTDPLPAICCLKTWITEPLEHIAEPARGKDRAAVPALHVGGGDQALGHQLRRTHDVGRVHCLVGRSEEEPFHSGRQRGLDHVLRPDDIGLDRRTWRPLAEPDMLEGRGMNDDVHPFHQSRQALQVADVGQHEVEMRHFL